MKQNNNSKKKTKYIAVSAILSAMGVVLLYFGSLIEVLDLSMAALASMLVIFAVIEMGGIYPFSVYFVTGLLALILLPVKLPAVYYLIFAGYYPIIKEKLERLHFVLEWIIKIVVFNIAFVAVLLISKYVFAIPDETKFMMTAIYILGNIVFVIYDIALTRLITFYNVKLRHRFRIK